MNLCFIYSSDSWYINFFVFSIHRDLMSAFSLPRMVWTRNSVVRNTPKPQISESSYEQWLPSMLLYACGLDKILLFNFLSLILSSVNPSPAFCTGFRSAVFFEQSLWNFNLHVCQWLHLFAILLVPHWTLGVLSLQSHPGSIQSLLCTLSVAYLSYINFKDQVIIDIWTLNCLFTLFTHLSSQLSSLQGPFLCFPFVIFWWATMHFGTFFPPWRVSRRDGWCKTEGRSKVQKTTNCLEAILSWRWACHLCILDFHPCMG